MGMSPIDVQKIQERRYQLLLKLWEAAAGKQLERVDFLQVAANAGFDNEEAKQIYLFFKDEGFFEYRNQLWGVSLSHKAIKEIERSIANPNEATEHFSATMIQHFNAPVGAVLTGPNSTANVNQNFGANMAEVAGLISQLREQFEALPPGPREEAIDVVSGLTEELQQPVPSKGKVKAFLSQVGVFAQDVAAGASAGLLTEAIARSLGWQSEFEMNEDLALIQESEKRRYKLLYEVWKAMRDGTPVRIQCKRLDKEWNHEGEGSFSSLSVFAG